jgi:hypothetical protein
MEHSGIRGRSGFLPRPGQDSIAFHPGYLLTPKLAELHMLSPELPDMNDTEATGDIFCQLMFVKPDSLSI